jgi:hypothetical protein
MHRWLDTLIQDCRDIRRGISYVQRGGIGRDIAHSESRFMRDVNLKTSGTRQLAIVTSVYDLYDPFERAFFFYSFWPPFLPF